MQIRGLKPGHVDLLSIRMTLEKREVQAIGNTYDHFREFSASKESDSPLKKRRRLFAPIIMIGQLPVAMNQRRIVI